jgi:hypothetical protein
MSEIPTNPDDPIPTKPQNPPPIGDPPDSYRPRPPAPDKPKVGCWSILWLIRLDGLAPA